MLELHSAVAGYRRAPILDGIDLFLRRGELCSLIGANGCGKSTLLRTLLGLLPLTAGEVTLDGNPLPSLKRSEIAKRIAYLPQWQGIPDMTVGELVLCGRFSHLSYPRRYRAVDRAAAKAAMQRTGTTEIADRPLRELSGGMRQAAYIAMALASETDCILLDEPTTYLDPAHAAATLRLLRELSHEGRAVLTVMHDLPMAFDFSDRILLLHQGRLLLDAPPNEACQSQKIAEALGISVFSIPGEEKYACRYL